MRNYYIECTVSYTDNSENTPFKSTEAYEFIIQSNSKKNAKEEAKNKSIELLKEDIGNMDDVLVVIDEIYETSDDARTN